MSAGLFAQNVSFSYNHGHPVLHDVSAEALRGAVVGILGPNGSGKTTLLRVLAGLLQPTHGAVTLDGTDLRTMGRALVARRVAVVPQETHPAFDYSVMDMVLMGRHPHLGPLQLEGPADHAEAARALDATHVRHLADRAFTALSGGEKQRVVIASALAQAGEVLLLDEPTASLDLGYQLEIGLLMQRLNRERSATMVMATHDLNLAASLCDTLVLMRNGRVLASGHTSEVLTSAMVRQLYDVEADVRVHELAGHLTVVPLGRLS